MNIKEIVREFVSNKAIAVDKLFTATELRQYVQKHSFGKAPASADRIMRQLRQRGEINYLLISRKNSQYLAQPVITESNGN